MPLTGAATGGTTVVVEGGSAASRGLGLLLEAMVVVVTVLEGDEKSENQSEITRGASIGELGSHQ